ncbi:MAG: hypothetical protein ACLU4N_07495 [Butyricimonas faecihominis]
MKPYPRVKSIRTQGALMSGGLSTTLRYKNLRMSAMFSYSLGAKTRLFRMFNDNIKPNSMFTVIF